MMRAWGRVNGVWKEVTTTPDGDNSLVYITNLIQVLRLNRNESPFYADWGIPSQVAVIQQIFPDIYVALTQQQFAPRFVSLIISRLPAPGADPVYQVALTTTKGYPVVMDIPG